MAKIGIFFGSTEGNTERIVNSVQEKLGGEDVAAIHNVSSSTAEDLASYDNLILACPTWEIGELQEDWDTFIDEMDDVEWDGKTVAYIGLGDADGYPDTFLDALGLIHEKIEDQDVTVVGLWPDDEYEYEDSKGLRDGKFLGVGIDEDNEPEKTDDRLNRWIDMIKPGFGV